MFKDKIRPLAILIGVLSYIVFAVIAFVVVMQFWWPAGLSKAEVARLAEVDPTLALAQGVISTSFAILAGYVACQMSGSHGLRNSVLAGVLLMLYAALNIHLHSNGAYLTHFMQFVGAVALPAIGGVIRLWLVRRRTFRQTGHA